MATPNLSITIATKLLKQKYIEAIYIFSNTFPLIYASVGHINKIASIREQQGSSKGGG